MITIRHIPNILNPAGRTKSQFPYWPEMSVAEYVNRSGYGQKDLRAIVSGKTCIDQTKKLKNGDEILLVPNVEFDPGTWAAIVAFSKVLFVVATVASIGYSVYTAVTYKKPATPTFGTQGGGGIDDSSPTYGWEGSQTIQSVGTPIPIIYGKHQIGANRINEYISTNGDKNYLNSLLALGEGEIESLESVSINENPVANFDGVELFFRHGRNEQDIIAYFNDLHDLNQVGATLLKDNPYIYTMSQFDVEAFEVKIVLPNGLYSQNSGDGSINSWLVTFKIEYKLHEESEWLLFTPDESVVTGDILNRHDNPRQEVPSSGSFFHNIIQLINSVLAAQYYLTPGYKVISDFVLTGENSTVISTSLYSFDYSAQRVYFNDQAAYDSAVSAGGGSAFKANYIAEPKPEIAGKSRTAIRRVFRKEGLAPGNYDIRVTRTSEDSSFYNTGDSQLDSIDEIRTDDLSYPNLALLGVRALATEQLSGAAPNYQVVVKGRKVSIPQILTEEGGSEVNWEDYYWDPLTSFWRKFSDDSALYWDGKTFVERWSANPIWCVRDLLLNSRYGLGNYIGVSDIDRLANLEMAKYSEEKVPDGAGAYEKRFRLDVVIDSPGKALDVVQQLASTFRGVTVVQGGQIQIRIDKPEDRVQIFGMGNIIADSYSEGIKSLKEAYNVIEVQYIDATKGYRDDYIAIIDKNNPPSATNPPRKKRVRIFATKLSYAIREGNYQLRAARACNRSITFKAGIEAIACSAFDIIGFSHDVPQVGFSGRVEAGSTVSTVKLDRQIAIETGKTYVISVRFADDVIEERTINSPVGNYTEVSVSAPFSSAPQSYDPYSFGEMSINLKDYRIMQVRREPDYTVQITALEYAETIYDESEDLIIPTFLYSALSIDIPPVTDLHLTETVIRLADGTIEDVIHVWFNKPLIASYRIKKYSKARIYLSDNDGASYVFRGETDSDNFQIQGGIVDLSTYRILVTSVTDKGEELARSLSPSEEITVLGKTANPSDVEDFDVVQQGGNLRFSWSPVPDVDLARYEIRQGADWATATVIANRTDTTEYILPVGEVGQVTFLIKAIDTSGNESATPGIDQITVVPPPDMNFLNTIDLWSSNIEYKLSNLELVWTNDYDKAYARRAFALKTATTWEEFEALYATWEAAEAAGIELNGTSEASGYWEQITPTDLETVFEFKLSPDLDYMNVAGGSVTVQVATSIDNITWGAFANINPVALYNARYLKFKVIITTSDTSHHIYLFDGLVHVNAPFVKLAWYRDISVPIGGYAVVFDVGFVFPPRVNAMIVNGVVGVPILSNKTKDGGDLFVHDTATQLPIAGAVVDLDAKGY